MQAKSIAGLADVAVKANAGGVSVEDVGALQRTLAALAADIHAGQAAKRAVSGAGVPVDRAEVLTDPAKFYAAMIAQSVGGSGEAPLSRDDIEQAIKYQAQRAQLGDLGFVTQALVGNMMQLQVLGAKLLAMAEAKPNSAADLMQRAGKLYTDAAKVGCSIAGLVRS